MKRKQDFGIISLFLFLFDSTLNKTFIQWDERLIQTLLSRYGTQGGTISISKATNVNSMLRYYCFETFQSRAICFSLVVFFAYKIVCANQMILPQQNWFLLRFVWKKWLFDWNRCGFYVVSNSILWRQLSPLSNHSNNSVHFVVSNNISIDNKPPKPVI